VNIYYCYLHKVEPTHSDTPTRTLWRSCMEMKTKISSLFCYCCGGNCPSKLYLHVSILCFMFMFRTIPSLGFFSLFRLRVPHCNSALVTSGLFFPFRQYYNQCCSCHAMQQDGILPGRSNRQQSPAGPVNIRRNMRRL